MAEHTCMDTVGEGLDPPLRSLPDTGMLRKPDGTF